MADAQQSDEEFFRDRQFGQIIGFGKNAAVLSVDFINAFTDPSTLLGSNLDDEVAAAVRVLDTARDTGVPIIHTTAAYDDADFADAGVWPLKQGGAKLLRAGTPAVELDARIKRRPNERLLLKKYASSFFGTDLSSHLVSSGVDTVIIVGCTTSGCVRASAVDALQSGFRPMVVEEAVGDRSAASHRQSLFDLHQKYADVVSLEETLNYLGG